MKSLNDYLNESMPKEYKDLDYLGEHLLMNFCLKIVLQKKIYLKKL